MFDKQLAENLKLKFGFKNFFTVRSGGLNDNSRGLIVFWDEGFGFRFVNSL